MDRAYLLEFARRERGLTQTELAARSGTSQAALSAYERGLKSPTLKVASRILEAAGFDINLRVHIDWTEHHPLGIAPFWAPNILWSVETPNCFATLAIPDEVGGRGRRDWNLRDREERKGAYQELIRWGLPEQMIRWMDGALLVDVWDELDLPDPIRAAWKWPIRVAREPTRPDPVGFFLTENPHLTPNAWNRAYEPLPKEPPKPTESTESTVRFIPTRFDPRPRDEQPGGDDPERAVGDAVDIAEIVDRLVAMLPTTRYPSARATWGAGVGFARRWLELGYDEQTMALAPHGHGCVVRVTPDLMEDKDGLADRLRAVARAQGQGS